MKALFLAMMLVPVMAFAGSQEFECHFGQEITIGAGECLVLIFADSQQLVARVKGSDQVFFVHRFQGDEVRNGFFTIRNGSECRLLYTGAAGARPGCYYLTMSSKELAKRDVAVESPLSLETPPSLPSKPVSEVKEVLMDIPLNQESAVLCGGHMVRLSLAVDFVNVYGFIDGRRFKMSKVLGYDTDRTNRTMIYSGFDGWHIYYCDGAGATPGKSRIAIVKE